MKKITPFLWFNKDAEQAMKFYRSIFKSTKVIDVHRKDGKVFWVHFQLHGQDIMALNGGPHFKPTPAFSFFVSCKDQKEVDYYWNKLCKGGRPSRCGWLQDKFGLSWQIIPTALGQLMGDKDKKKADRVFDAMMKMSKIDIAALKRAYHNK